MDWTMAWSEGPLGLLAWLGVMLAIVGVALLMRHLAVSSRAMELRQTALIVAASLGLVVIAGIGGLALMHTV